MLTFVGRWGLEGKADTVLRLTTLRLTILKPFSPICRIDLREWLSTTMTLTGKSYALWLLVLLIALQMYRFRIVTPPDVGNVAAWLTICTGSGVGR